MQTTLRESAIREPASPSYHSISKVQLPKPNAGLYLGLAVLALLVVNSLAVVTIYSLIN